MTPTRRTQSVPAIPSRNGEETVNRGRGQRGGVHEEEFSRDREHWCRRVESSPNLGDEIFERRRSRLELLVDGLVGGVKEYMERGGYSLADDDHGDRWRGWEIVTPLPGEADFQNEGAVMTDRVNAYVSTSTGEETLQGLQKPLLSEVSLSSESMLLTEVRVAGDWSTNAANAANRGHFSGQIHEGNSVTKTAVTFLKGMVGSFILYTPHMFAEGGILFSSVSLLLIAAASMYNILLLLHCREHLRTLGVPALSFGDVGMATCGNAGRGLIDASLFLSQLGYCVTYMIFVAENTGMAIRPFLPSEWEFLGTTVALVLLQMAIQVPLSWVRRLAYLGVGLLVANACILLGMAFILSEVAQMLIQDGVASGGGDGGGGGGLGAEGVVLINPGQCLIVLGSIVGCFEGIGLVIPIQDAMDASRRHLFKPTLIWSMAGISLFYLAFACCGYLAFGGEVKEFITLDLPDDSTSGVITRLAYSLALILTYPLQLFPAVNVLERLIWPAPKEGKKSPSGRRKWLKNLLRAGLVGLTAYTALVAGDKFDSFVGLVSGVCAVPLALIYPVAFHLRLRGNCDNHWQAFLHWFLLGAGVFAGVASSVVAIKAL